MKKNISTILLVLLFLIGLSIFLYPTISNLYNERVGSHLISQYSNEVKEVKDDKIEEILNKAKIYNEDLLKKPTRFINGPPHEADYSSQLKIDNSEIIGYIEIKKLNARFPIYKGTSEPVLQMGVGHLEGSALPIGGEGNHTVVSGHTGLPSAKLLTNLDKLVNGDIIVVNVCGKTITYSVIASNVVLPEEIELLKPQKGKDLLTIFTCTPYGVNTHRLLVTGERVDNSKGDVISSGESETSNLEKYPIISIIPLIVIWLIIILIKKRKRKSGEV